LDHKVAEIHKERIYYKTIKSAKESSLISVNDNILVVCAGHQDKRILESQGFKNVTISNLDERLDNDEFAPYQYSYQNAEDLSYGDDAFDWVIVHAGLHHCYRPHRALLEMLRVGKKGAIVFEARDSSIMRIGKKYNLVPTYEIEAVIGNDLKYGGVANSSIPNYIYRWKEREIESILNAYFPNFQDNKVHYFYNLRLPTKRISIVNSPIKRMAMHAFLIPLRILCAIFPKQSNEFCFIMKKGTQLHSWLKVENGAVVINPDVIKKDFNLDKSF